MVVRGGMAKVQWIGFSAAGTTIGALVAFPGAREFLLAAWTSFQQESLANEIAIAVSVLTPIVGLLGSGFLWSERKRKNLEERIKILEHDLEEENRKREAAEHTAEELAKRAPDRILDAAITADKGRPENEAGISILEQGLEVTAEPLAKICRRLAVKLNTMGGDDDLKEAARVQNIASVLYPDDRADRSIAAETIERKAAAAMSAGTYDPYDPQFAPVLPQSCYSQNEALAEARVLCGKSKDAGEAGDYFLAERLAARVVAIAAFAPDTPTYFVAQYVHAQAMLLLGHYAQALTEIDGYAERQETVLGVYHRNVLATRQLRARVLYDLGRIDEALAEIDGCAEREESMLGADHHHVFLTRRLLAQVLNELGRCAEALTEIEGFAERQETVCGADHPDVFQTQYLRVRILNDLGRSAEAQTAIDRYSKRQEMVLGADHPNVFMNRLLRTEILRDLGRAAGALTEIDRYAGRQETVLGVDHPDVFATRYLRAQVLRDLGRSAEALAEIDRFAGRQKTVLGVDHPAVIATQNLRAEIAAAIS